MSKPLFYRNCVPLNTEKHRDLRMQVPEHPYKFAREANLIPALIDEFASALGHLPVAFLPGAAAPAAVFVTGLAPGTSAFVTEDGQWNAEYLPAYLRRYPFIIGEVDGQDPVLCIDESHEGLGSEGGERLFSDEGESEAALIRALEFAQGYRTAAERTERFSERLRELELFRSVTLDATDAHGARTSVHGLMIVDEDALAALPDDTVLSLHKDGYMRFIHAHLFSLRAISRLAQAQKTEIATPRKQGAA